MIIRSSCRVKYVVQPFLVCLGVKVCEDILSFLLLSASNYDTNNQQKKHVDGSFQVCIFQISPPLYIQRIFPPKLPIKFLVLGTYTYLHYEDIFLVDYSVIPS